MGRGMRIGATVEHRRMGRNASRMCGSRIALVRRHGFVARSLRHRPMDARVVETLVWA